MNKPVNILKLYHTNQDLREAIEMDYSTFVGMEYVKNSNMLVSQCGNTIRYSTTDNVISLAGLRFDQVKINENVNLSQEIYEFIQSRSKMILDNQTNTQGQDKQTQDSVESKPCH